MKLSRITPLALPLLIAAGLAQAETTNCTPIQSLPATITTSGIYCLTSDLLTNIPSGNAIEIAANFVTLDLNGWRMGGGAAGTATTAVGIHALDRRGITIRNGSIKGFLTGISIDGNASTSTSHLIDGIRADANMETGIFLSASNSIVRNSQITNTGGSTAATGNNKAGIYVNGGDSIAIMDNDIDFVAGGSTNAGGIWCNAQNSVVSNNRIAHVSSASAAVGVEVDGYRSFVRGNQISSLEGFATTGIYSSSNANQSVVSENQIVGSQTTNSFGISFGQSSVFRDNVIVGFVTGITSQQGVYSGNIVLGATTPYQGGTLHGTTNTP